MGVQLNKLASTADKLLDFQTSLTDQMSLSLMLGERINLNTARQLFANGQLVQGMTQLRNAIGGIDLQGLNPMQAAQLAQTLGFSVKQLTAMDARTKLINKHMNQLSTIDKERLKTYGLTMRLTDKMSTDQVQMALASAAAKDDMRNSLTKIADSWSIIGAKAAGFLAKQRNLKAIQNTLSVIGWVVKAIANIFGTLASTGPWGVIITGVIGFATALAFAGKKAAILQGAITAINKVGLAGRLVGDGLATKIKAPIPVSTTVPNGTDGITKAANPAAVSNLFGLAAAIAAVGVAMVGVGYGVKLMSEGFVLLKDIP